MNTLIFCALLGAQPTTPVIKFDTLTPDQAARFADHNVTIRFTVGDAPAYTWPVNGQLRTICGPVMRDGDDQERTVSLIGDRTRKTREGKTHTVRGMLRVVHHEAVTINGVRVEAWADIRFEER
ncbi:hypothetical protein VT84_06940 [Gemmata sp. SH-PL17]|uniref:hypothetical protein n=1 Tax=Gemmata sp. SH-PL17 TaxID=1630693 RepID=UPI00078EAF45|nr:hypothetical protein [Gemmata sp. SH-PL17]AMV24115.1 hypothetical protein VT84_06940 [Gemmata sp. SH-PL17]